MRQPRHDVESFGVVLASSTQVWVYRDIPSTALDSRLGIACPEKVRERTVTRRMDARRGNGDNRALNLRSVAYIAV